MARIDVNFNSSSDSTAQATNEINQNGQQTQPTQSTSSYLIGQAVVAVGKRALQFGANQVGNITGNYLMQNQINNAVQALGWASQLAVGFATGGAVGGVVSAIAIAGEIGINAANYTVELNKRNREAEYLRIIRGGILNANSR